MQQKVPRTGKWYQFLNIPDGTITLYVSVLVAHLWCKDQ